MPGRPLARPSLCFSRYNFSAQNAVQVSPSYCLYLPIIYSPPFPSVATLLSETNETRTRCLIKENVSVELSKSALPRLSIVRSCATVRRGPLLQFDGGTRADDTRQVMIVNTPPEVHSAPTPLFRLKTSRSVRPARDQLYPEDRNCELIMIVRRTYREIQVPVTCWQNRSVAPQPPSTVRAGWIRDYRISDSL